MAVTDRGPPWDSLEDCFAKCARLHKQRHGGQESLEQWEAITESEENFTHPEDYAVYTINCIPRSTATFDLAKDVFGYVPEWVEASTFYDTWWYIGLTTDIERRYTEHLEGGEAAADFTKIYKPDWPLSVEFFPTFSEAREYELEFADVLRKMGFVPYAHIR